MSKKITSGNYNSTTKQQIFNAYNEVLSQLEVAQSQKLDPAREVAVRKTAETLSKAENTASKSIEDQIASLQKNIAATLGSLSNGLTVEIEAYNNIKESIKVKEAELKELFDIEKQAFTLAALIDTHKEVSAKQEAENAERQAKALEELKAVNAQIQEARISFQEDIKKEKEALRIERAREKEEYEYSFKRQKQIAKDQLEDELAAERKEFELEVETREVELKELSDSLNKRETEIEARELKLEELESQVAAFPAREAQIRAEVAEQVKKDEARTAAIKDSYVKKEAEHQKALYENKIELLENALREAQSKNAELTEKLDTAYEKIQNMALASVDGSKAQAAAADLAKQLMAQSK